MSDEMDWRKKWKDRDYLGREVLFVAPFGDSDGDFVYIYSSNGNCSWGRQGPIIKRLIPLESTTRKVEAWALFERKTGRLVSTFTDEASARGCCVDKWVAVGLCGEYEVPGA